MSATANRHKSSYSRINNHCRPEDEINILLMGQTGVGKTTFINSLANYMNNNTFDEAIKDDMMVIIPSAFHMTDFETFESKVIRVGPENEDENISDNGQSCTQQCRSFVFPFGKRNLRVIDTPGMGDTRGSQQDNENLFEILTYISHYEHLNAICILLKPNEERVTISFRLCIRQILNYLHPSAVDNLVYIFTNARATHFIPGSSKRLLEVLLQEYSEQYNRKVPFLKENTFLIDNETFRCLALINNKIRLSDEQIQPYRKSWDHTVKEYQRLLHYVSNLPLHATGYTLSLNGAEQIIKRLSRPIAETMRLIQQNIQLANKYKKKFGNKTENKLRGMISTIIEFKSPKLLCYNKKCLEKNMGKDENGVSNIKECHNDSYLDGVIQEVVRDPKIKRLKEFDNQTGNCTICGCSYTHHMNVTYEFRANLPYKDIKQDKDEVISAADEYIKDLNNEQLEIDNIYMKLLKFLYINAIHPRCDDILDYLKLFIQEEQIKKNSDSQNDEIVTSLENKLTTYQKEINNFKATLTEQHSKHENEILSIEAVFSEVGKLSRLPNGKTIRKQIDLLKYLEDKCVKEKEKAIQLPRKNDKSNMMPSTDVDSTRI